MGNKINSNLISNQTKVPRIEKDYSYVALYAFFALMTVGGIYASVSHVTSIQSVEFVCGCGMFVVGIIGIVATKVAEKKADAEKVKKAPIAAPPPTDSVVAPPVQPQGKSAQPSQPAPQPAVAPKLVTSPVKQVPREKVSADPLQAPKPSPVKLAIREKVSLSDQPLQQSPTPPAQPNVSVQAPVREESTSSPQQSPKKTVETTTSSGSLERNALGQVFPFFGPVNSLLKRLN